MSTQISLTQLVPLNCTEKVDQKPLKNLLNNYTGVMGLTRASVNSFLSGDFPDPLVGENACQIRASIYCQIAGDPAMISELQKVALMLEKNPINLANISLPKRASLGEVLEENHLDVQVPKIVSLVLSPILCGYILTKTKDSKLTIEKTTVSLMESNDHTLLEGVSAKFAKELIKEARRLLSATSIDYLRREVNMLPLTPKREILSRIMHDHVLSDPLGLQTSPLLPGMQILIGRMKVQRIPIVLKDQIITNEKKEETLTLLFEPKDNSYEVVEDTVDKNRPGFIVEAVAISNQPRSPIQLAKSLIQIGIEKIIFANAAAHPQYGGVHKSVEPTFIEDREELKTFALEQGLCAMNPSLCRIFHIYAGLLSKHLGGKDDISRK